MQYYPAAAPQVAYVARQTQKSPSIAFIAYGVAASAASCQSEQNSLKAAGYKVSYSDLKVNYPGSTVATDVQRMKQAGSNMVVSCMDVQGNVTMARAIKQYGLNMTQLWFSGNDQSTLNTNESLMQGVYFDIGHVPFTASPTLYPGLKLYFAQMKKYEPAYVTDEIALQGWESAALFVQGVKMAGQQPHPGQRDQGGQLLDRLHLRRSRGAGQLEERRAQRACAALLPRLHQGVRRPIRARPSTRGRTSSTASSRPTRRRTRSSRCRPARPPRPERRRTRDRRESASGNRA